MTVRLQLVSVVLLAALFPHPQNMKKLRKLEEKFEKQKDAVHRAKALAKMMTKEVDAASAEIRKGEIQQGVKRLEHCRDLAIRVHSELLATGRNPVKKSDGFKQLQIATRESVRRLNDLIFLMPVGRRGPVEVVREDLDQLNDQLLTELFPPPKPKPKKKKHKT
jgi:hypothetical protein